MKYSIDSLLGQLSNEQKTIVFRYLFRLIENRQFRAYFEDGIALKKKIDDSGYLLKNCKVYAWAYHKSQLDGSKKPDPAKYGVADADARFLRTLDLRKVPRQFAAPTMEEFEATIARELCGPVMKTYMGKFISKKLRFLVKSYGLERHDIESDILVGGLYSVYRMFPYFLSDLHLMNVAKVGIKRTGQDLIQEHTSDSKQRLRKTADGTNESLVLQLAAVEHILQAEEEQHYHKDLQRVVALFPKMTERSKRFVILLGGFHDPEFSEYLGLDNEKAAESMKYTRYRTKVQKFMGVDPIKAERFLTKVRQQLS